MSPSPGAEPAVYAEINYLNADRGVWSWLTTVDHKRIGIMYFVSVLFAFLLGGIFAMAIRIEHLTPDPTIMGANTYIGNAPNFMVKAIAESRGLRMPGFFAYMLWSGAILLPIFGVMTVVFFR